MHSDVSLSVYCYRHLSHTQAAGGEEEKCSCEAYAEVILEFAFLIGRGASNIPQVKVKNDRTAGKGLHKPILGVVRALKMIRGNFGAFDGTIPLGGFLMEVVSFGDISEELLSVNGYEISLTEYYS